jgi:hypothetical protein
LGLFVFVLGSLGCRRAESERGTEFDPHELPPIVTTLAIAQDWTASLLEGIARPVLVYDALALQPKPELTEHQRAIAANLTVLVCTGGSADAAIIEALRPHLSADAVVLVAREQPGADNNVFYWLDEAANLEALNALEAQWAELLPGRAGDIARNADAARARWGQAHATARARLAPHAATSTIWLADDRLAPWLRNVGLRSEGGLHLDGRIQLQPAERDAFQDRVVANPGAVLLAHEVPLVAFDTEALAANGVALVGCNALLQGWTKAGHGPAALERNALHLATVLASRGTPAAAP